MSQSHKFSYWFQFLILIVNVFMFTFFGSFGSAITVLLWLPFFVSEIIILEKQRRTPREQIFYHKSCLFGFLDLGFALSFLTLFALQIYHIIVQTDFAVNQYFLITLFTYTLIRKIYIYKNYSYEK
ncbi:hypothetical protein [Chryseobacterium sp. FH1]|uniref:hypothetical protein n=1 Tax=Chryseobacterium sp. FH1 TaxID=1233951 RepID=UPI0004E42255|nr:hypothetical protein [Chryseobacterium sp. FH1]KFC19380.1 hypothetical protein IO90_08755 [Chryseobacterium sp. FH1]